MQQNRLAAETSPYLRQHANNPVDWYAWGPEALERARQEDRPIFLSVGYSACHWCHVMEHESFENEAIAAQLNAAFVSIKVDREERPDIDELYMQAVQLFSGGHGGWPMSVFLTPQLEPFFGGTYFPPTERHGMPSFPQVLHFTAEAYRARRGDVETTARQVVDALRTMAELPPSTDVPDTAVLDNAFATLERAYDPEAGGFGGAPKFPPSMALSFLLRYQARTAAPSALRMVNHTLLRMARGGLCDQLGGGFHRYSTDARWLVPHFEKMLYDNALLARTYVEAWQATGAPWLRDVATETLGYLGREMRAPGGGFAAAQDADSENSEGKFFAWTPDEITARIGAADGRVVCRYFGVEARGNFEAGTSVLSIPRDPEVVAAELGLGIDELSAIVRRARTTLFAARAERVAPGRDDKVVVAWNGLAISAFARAARAFDDAAWLAPAREAAAFILDHMTGDTLFRTYKDERTKGPGFLDDYAAFITGLLDLYESTFEPRWIDAAQRLDAVLDADFWDSEHGGFFFTGRGHEALLARSRQPYDNATPAGNSLHAGNLLRLAALTGDGGTRQRAWRTLTTFGRLMRDSPGGMAEMLCALDWALGPNAEVAIVGRGPAARALATAVHRPFAPHKVVAGWPEQGPPAGLALLAGREPPASGAAAHVCRDFACQVPVTDPAGIGAAFVAAGLLTARP